MVLASALLWRHEWTRRSARRALFDNGKLWRESLITVALLPPSAHIMRRPRFALAPTFRPTARQQGARDLLREAKMAVICWSFVQNLGATR